MKIPHRGYNVLVANIVSSLLYNTIQYNTIQYNTIQYNTIQYLLQYNTYLVYNIYILLLFRA